MNTLKKLCLYMAMICVCIACNRENELSPKDELVSHQRTVDPGNVAAGPGQSILGDELQNPYDLDFINSAYELLYGESGNFTATHYYIKFNVSNAEHVAQIHNFETSHPYEFSSTPLHFEILYEGEEEYNDPSVGEDGGFSPEYGAVALADMNHTDFPNVPYEVLNEMNIPVYESRLTFTAFVISGNEEYYEAINGPCHPDCPTWPDCLDDADLSCDVTNNEYQALSTLNPYSDDVRINFPGYILDGALGYAGEVDGGDVLEGLEYPPECMPGCVARIRVDDSTIPAGLEWFCDCSGITNEDGEDEDDGLPPGYVEQCDCLVHVDNRKPGGKMILVDTQLGDEGIRRIKVKTTRHHWGFIWKTTNTDDEGCWAIDKRYNVKRIKVKAVFDDRVSERMTIRSFRGIRFWNAFLKPVKHNWNLKHSDKVWNDLCLRIENDDDNTSRNEQSFVAASVNNGVHEYYDDHSNLQGPDELKILIHTLNDNLDSAPMFDKIDQNNITNDDVYQWLLAFGIPLGDFIHTYWEWIKPDVCVSFGEDDLSDHRKATTYHEMAHVSQYQALGDEWWTDYFFYLLGIYLSDQEQPYGDGTSPGFGRAEVTEGMATAIEHNMADLQYGLNHSNGSDPEADRFSRLMEATLYWDGDFIPQGLFYDIFDDNATAGTTEPPNSGIIDNVINIQFEDQMNALNPNTVDIPTYRDALWQQFGLQSGNQINDYNQLFNSYGF